MPKSLARLAVKAANQKHCEHQLDDERNGFIDGAFVLPTLCAKVVQAVAIPTRFVRSLSAIPLICQHYCADRAKNPRYIYVRGL